MKLDVNRFFIFEIEGLPGFPTLAEFIETDAIAKGKAIYHCRFPRSRARSYSPRIFLHSTTVNRRIATLICSTLTDFSRGRARQCRDATLR